MKVVLSIVKKDLLLLDLSAAALLADAGMKKNKETKKDNETTHAVSKNDLSNNWKHKGVRRLQHLD